MRKITQIIVHCSDTKVGQKVTAADIDRWHRKRGFESIGYHFVVQPDGAVECGRPIDEIGAHCKGHNTNSIGICYIGGLDSNGKTKDTRTEAQKATIAWLIARLREDFGQLEVYGHKDFNKNKACPCFNARKEYN